MVHAASVRPMWMGKTRMPVRKKWILAHTSSSSSATLSILYGTCMKDHPREAILPHINGNVGIR